MIASFSKFFIILEFSLMNFLPWIKRTCFIQYIHILVEYVYGHLDIHQWNDSSLIQVTYSVCVTQPLSLHFPLNFEHNYHQKWSATGIGWLGQYNAECDLGAPPLVCEVGQAWCLSSSFCFLAKEEMAAFLTLPCAWGLTELPVCCFTGRAGRQLVATDSFFKWPSQFITSTLFLADGNCEWLLGLDRDECKKGGQLL